MHLSMVLKFLARNLQFYPHVIGQIFGGLISLIRRLPAKLIEISDRCIIRRTSASRLFFEARAHGAVLNSKHDDSVLKANRRFDHAKRRYISV